MDHYFELQVHLENDTVWLTQKQMSVLFDRDRIAITQHLGNKFKEKESDNGSVCNDSFHTTDEGKKFKTTSYNPKVLISFGFRVKTKTGSQFRQSFTVRLKREIPLNSANPMNQIEFYTIANNQTDIEVEFQG